MASVVTGIIGLLVAALIIALMRRDRLHATHGLAWIVIAITFALLGFAPGLVDKVARVFGISYPPVLALTLGIAFLVVKILFMDIERARIRMRNQRLVQRVAMLEADLRRLEKNPADVRADTTISSDSDSGSAG